MIWSAELDGGVIEAAAISAEAAGPDTFDLANLSACRPVLARGTGKEHVALCDGDRRLRIDIVDGTLLAGPVLLEVRVTGISRIARQLPALQRLTCVARAVPMPRRLQHPDRRVARSLLALRVHDALVAGAGRREIGTALFGAEQVDRGWGSPSDSAQSRVRRLVGAARSMAEGGYRRLLGP